MTAGNGLNLMLMTYKVHDTGPPERIEMRSVHFPYKTQQDGPNGPRMKVQIQGIAERPTSEGCPGSHFLNPHWAQAPIQT